MRLLRPSVQPQLRHSFSWFAFLTSQVLSVVCRSSSTISLSLLRPPFPCLFLVHRFPVFSSSTVSLSFPRPISLSPSSTIMSALSSYLAASDGTPGHSHSQTRNQARDSDPFARWAATSPLGRRGHVDQVSPLGASAGSAEDNEAFTPLTPAPRRLAPQAAFSGPTPAQRRRDPSSSPSRALDSEHVASSPTTRLGRRAREPSQEPSQDEERGASDSLFRASNLLSPRSRKKRRGIARSVSATFGLPEATLDQFSEVGCHRT